MTAPTVPPVSQEPEQAPVEPKRRARARTAAMRTVRRLRDGIRARLSADGPRPAWLMAIVAAAWAAVIGLGVAAVPLLVIWMATPQSGLTWLESLRLAGLLWVVAHGVPVTLSGVTYSLLPWGLAVVPVLLLGYSGGWAARRSEVATTRGLLVLVCLGAGGYAAIVGTVAAVTSQAAVEVSPGVAAGTAGVLALVAFGWGAVRYARIDVIGRVPAWLAVSVRAGLIGAVAILGLGALAATASLLVHVDDAITMAQSLHAGVGGGLGLLILGIAYLPVMAVWASSYVIGAGVVIGPAVAISPFIPVTAPTQLPPFPLLAALPQATTPVMWALPLVGIVGGVLAGLAIARRARTEPRLTRLAMALAAAAVSGGVMLVLAYLASGSLGNLRLAQVGPSPVTVAVLTAVLVTLGAVPSAVIGAPPAKPALSVLPTTSDDVPAGTSVDG